MKPNRSKINPVVILTVEVCTLPDQDLPLLRSDHTFETRGNGDFRLTRQIDFSVGEFGELRVVLMWTHGICL